MGCHDQIIVFYDQSMLLLLSYTAVLSRKNYDSLMTASWWIGFCMEDLFFSIVIMYACVFKGSPSVSLFDLKMCQVMQVSSCEMLISLSLVRATNTLWSEWRKSGARWAAATYVVGNESSVQVEEPSQLIELFLATLISAFRWTQWLRKMDKTSCTPVNISAI